MLRYRADQLERLGAPGPDAPWHAESSQRTAAPGLRTGARRHRKRHQCARRLPACRPDTAQVQCRWVLLPQPFKLTRVGPVNLFVDDYEALKRWHTDVLSFTLTEEIEWQGEQCAYLRCDNEHHSLGIFPKSWRKKLGLSEATSNMSFGLQLANYQQLKSAVNLLRGNGVRVETEIIPPELNPSIDYAAYAFDPDGDCLELYYYMEQVGWDGRPRPKEMRHKVDPHNWPEILEPLSDIYSGEPFVGPWA